MSSTNLKILQTSSSSLRMPNQSLYQIITSFCSIFYLYFTCRESIFTSCSIFFFLRLHVTQNVCNFHYFLLFLFSIANLDGQAKGFCVYFINCYPGRVLPISDILTWHVICFHPMCFRDNSNGGFEQARGITKIIISLLPRCLWPPKLAWPPTHKVNYPCNSWSYEITWQTRSIISPVPKCL